MPAYLITHPRDQKLDDLVIEDPALTLRFEAGWPSSLTTGVCASPSPAGKARPSSG
jgi:hypothetical protein